MRSHEPWRVFNLSSTTNFSSSDYNGFMAGPSAKFAFGWNSPPDGNMNPNYTGKLVMRSFPTLAAYSAATGQDKHSIMVSYADFENLQPVGPDPTHVYDIDSLDFQLKPTSPAVDAGEVLPNINDGYVGKAPDLGALEFGAPPPHYGPR